MNELPSNRAGSTTDLVYRFENSKSSRSRMVFQAKDLERISRYYEDEFMIEDALLAIDYGLELHPKYSRFLLHKAGMYLSLNDFEGSHALIDAFEADTRADIDSVDLRLRCYLLEERFEDAENLIGFWLSIFDGADKLRLLFRKAELLQKIGKLESAFAILKGIVSERPNYTEAVIRIGALVEVLGNYEESLALHTTLLGAKGNAYNAQMYLNQGQAYYALSEYTLAAGAFENSYTSDPKFWQGYYEHASLLFSLQRYHRALRVFSDLINLQHDVDETELLLHIGQCQYFIGQEGLSEVYFEKVLQEDACNDVALYHYGLCLERKGLEKSAFEHFLKASKVCPRDETYLLAAARLAVRFEKHKKAATLLEQATLVAPEIGECWYQLCRLYFLNGKFDRVVAKVEIAEEETYEPRLFYIAAAALFALGNRTGGFAYLQAAIDQDYDAGTCWRDFAPELFEDTDICAFIDAFKPL